MKMILKRIVPMLALASWLVLPARADGKIGTVDMRKLFDNYWKRQTADAALKDRERGLEKDLKGYTDDYKKMQEDYKKLLAGANEQSVTAAERDKRKAAAESKLVEIKTLDNTIRTFEENAHDQLDSQVKRMRESILSDIRTAVSAKAKIAGFVLVVDTAAESVNGTPIILYSNGENDLTEGILTQLNAGAPPPSADATPATNRLDLKPVDKK